MYLFLVSYLYGNKNDHHRASQNLRQTHSKMFVEISCSRGWKVEKIFVEKQGTDGNMFKGRVHIMTLNTKDLHVCPGLLDQDEIYANTRMGVHTQVYEIPPEILPEHLGLPSTYKMLTGTIYGNTCHDGIIISGTARRKLQLYCQ